jgi:choline dehydrogenase-like flavoprotein
MADSLIVEAGSAGCVLANRLSVDANTQVAVLEAGGSDRHVLYRMPGGYVGIIQRGLAIGTTRQWASLASTDTPCGAHVARSSGDPVR